jgi:N-acetylmuramoyl-L-alanine amidase
LIMPEMKGLVLRGFTPAAFKTYLRVEVAKKMAAWRPRGVVLHNTGKMVWPGFTPAGKQITPEQRLRNMSVDWVARGFRGGPHLVIAPDGMIWTAWPLWLQGTHSPSYNATFWGVELVGAFDSEPFPDAMRKAATEAAAGLYAMLGHEPDGDSFHFHKEDPRTAHRNCPGKNVGGKPAWVSAIRGAMHAQNPGELLHVA